jgi:UDP-glucose 4-epimerase
MEDPFNDLELNGRATLSLLEACRHVNRDARLVFASTRQTYGRARSLPVSEDALLRPVDVNGVNKMAAEWFHLVYHEVHHVRSVSLRLVNTFGPRQLLRHSRQGFVGWFIRLAVDGEEIPIFGDGTQLRDINFVDDVVDALLLAGAGESLAGEIFNLGSPEPLSLESFVRTLIEVAGAGSYRMVPFPDSRRTIDVGSFYSDYTRFRSATGWTPKVSLRDGLLRTVEYYRRYRDRYWD